MGFLHDQARNVFYPQISDTIPIAHEVKIGSAFHYLIAVVWAVAFHIFFVGYPLFELSYENGLLFGALTTLAPLFIFMPFTGQGVLARWAVDFGSWWVVGG